MCVYISIYTHTCTHTYADIHTHRFVHQYWGYEQFRKWNIVTLKNLIKAQFQLLCSCGKFIKAREIQQKKQATMQILLPPGIPIFGSKSLHRFVSKSSSGHPSCPLSWICALSLSFSRRDQASRIYVVEDQRLERLLHVIYSCIKLQTTVLPLTWEW